MMVSMVKSFDIFKSKIQFDWFVDLRTMDLFPDCKYLGKFWIV